MSSDEPKLRSLGFRNGIEWLELELEGPPLDSDSLDKIAAEAGMRRIRYGFDSWGPKTRHWIQGVRLEPPKDPA